MTRCENADYDPKRYWDAFPILDQDKKLFLSLNGIKIAHIYVPASFIKKVYQLLTEPEIRRISNFS